jgi:hypothetical protein
MALITNGSERASFNDFNSGKDFSSGSGLISEPHGSCDQLQR